MKLNAIEALDKLNTVARLPNTSQKFISELIEIIHHGLIAKNTLIKRCKACEYTGRIQMEPDSAYSHPCDDCRPADNKEYQRGFSNGVEHTTLALQSTRKPPVPVDTIAVPHDLVLMRRIVGWLNTAIEVAGIDPETTEIKVETEKRRIETFNMADDIKEILASLDAVLSEVQP